MLRSSEMSAPDRSWTIAPTIGWFVAFLVAGLWWFDRDMSALADRLTTHREAHDRPAGPVFTAPPVVVAETDSDDTEPAAPLPAAGGGSASHDVGALVDTCVDGKPEACKRWAMDGFYRAIDEEKKGSLGHALRVSWYGDSVVATDAIPGRLRARLQGELGDGGPGFVYVVAPHRFCHHESITRS